MDDVMQINFYGNGQKIYTDICRVIRKERGKAILWNNGVHNILPEGIAVYYIPNKGTISVLHSHPRYNIQLIGGSIENREELRAVAYLTGFDDDEFFHNLVEQFKEIK